MSQESEALEHYHIAGKGKTEIGQSKYYNDQPADYLFYKALANYQTQGKEAAKATFDQMIEWAEDSISDEVKTDFFAVSLPDLIVFNNDLQAENQVHCLFVKAMGQLGLHLIGEKPMNDFDETIEALLQKNPAHSKANLFKKMAKTLETTL